MARSVSSSSVVRAQAAGRGFGWVVDGVCRALELAGCSLLVLAGLAPFLTWVVAHA